MGHLLRPVGNIVAGQAYMDKAQRAGQAGQLVTANLESEFRAAQVLQTQASTYVEPVHPVSSVSFRKIGDRMIKVGGVLDVTKNAPLFNDPRYTSSTLAIPTDDRTLHGLYRFFADTDPIVGAALRIHAELPMANLQLEECEDTGVQAHFEEMAERINLIRTLTDGVKEYWTIGNDYFFGAWNEKDYMFDQFTLLNPDYVKVESTWLNQKPLVKLIPDEGLKKIVQTRSPDYLYKQLSPEIIRYVLYNNEIPLHPNNVFILSHDKAPYEVKGKSLIKRLLKILMYEDRLQQAQFAIATRHIVPLTIVKLGDPTTGWVPDSSEMDSFRDMLAAWELDPNFSIVYHYGVDVQFYGACHDDQTEILTESGWKLFKDVVVNEKVATYNRFTQHIEYQIPQEYQKYKFVSTDCESCGKMYHFDHRSLDVMVTPNHRMLVIRNGKEEVVTANKVKHGDKFINTAKWEGTLIDGHVDSPLSHLSLDEFIEYAGYFVSEGSLIVDKNRNTGKQIVACAVYQKKSSKFFERMYTLSKAVFPRLGLYKSGERKNDVHAMTVNSVDIARYLADTFGTHSFNKRIPVWMKNLPCKQLEILITALMNGDGSTRCRLDGITRNKYQTVSKNLADDVSEILLKLGHFSTTSVETCGPNRTVYRIGWSSLVGDSDCAIREDRDGIKKLDYDGFVYCVTVPNGFIVTRRHGRITIQGNSGKILPVGPEFDRVYKLKFIGMGIHEQLMTGGGGSYAQAYANLEIQRQRYLNLQLKVEQMVHIGWFKTVSEMCGFYRMSQPVVGSYYRGKAYGSAKDAGRDLMKVYSGIRDYQDNEEFRTFFTKKSQELKDQELTQRREYVYPKLDWGAMSAANDENYKNWVKWLRKEVPWLVDEATLARIARLDPTAQEKAFFRDIARRKARETEIIKQGLAPWAQAQKPGPPTGDFGGDQSMDIGPMAPPMGGAGDLGGGGMPDMAGGGSPGAPIGAGGPPVGGAAAGAPPGAPPAMASQESTALEALGSELLQATASEIDRTLESTRAFNVERSAIDREVGLPQ